MDGKWKNLSPLEQKFYDLKSNNLFCPYASPPVTHHNDSNFITETFQSVVKWRNYVSRNKLTSLSKFVRSRKHKIYLCLIGPFPDYFCQGGVFCLNIMECLKAFTEAFFPGMCVVFMDKIIDYREINCRTRFHQKSKQKQLFLPDINMFLKNFRPKDAFCICGMSWFDFYPDDDLNHILGGASFDSGTVAFSFGHYYKFKETEAKLKEWEADFVIEPSIEIADSLNKNGQQSREDLVSSSYVYITSNEKEEAIYRTIDNDEHNCISTLKTRSSSSPKSGRNSPNSPKLRKLSSKVQSLIERHSPSHSLSSLPTVDSFMQTDIQCPTAEKTVLSLVSDITMTDIDNRVNGNSVISTKNCDTDDNLEWDTCQDLDPPQSAKSEVEVNKDNLLRSALPSGCEFQIDCQILRRLFRVISHEICHVLGMTHCQYYTCTLNASASILDVDMQPLFLCPICVRKLQIALKFDLIYRYKQIDSFLTLHGHENFLADTNFVILKSCELQADREKVQQIIDFITS